MVFEKPGYKSSISSTCAAVLLSIAWTSINNIEYWSNGSGIFKIINDVFYNTMIGFVIFIFVHSGSFAIAIIFRCKLNFQTIDDHINFTSIVSSVTSVILLFSKYL
jgi:hypothetical protein